MVAGGDASLSEQATGITKKAPVVPAGTIEGRDGGAVLSPLPGLAKNLEPVRWLAR